MGAAFRMVTAPERRLRQATRLGDTDEMGDGRWSRVQRPVGRTRGIRIDSIARAAAHGRHGLAVGIQIYWEFKFHNPSLPRLAASLRRAIRHLDSAMTRCFRASASAVWALSSSVKAPTPSL